VIFRCAIVSVALVIVAWLSYSVLSAVLDCSYCLDSTQDPFAANCKRCLVPAQNVYYSCNQDKVLSTACVYSKDKKCEQLAETNECSPCCQFDDVVWCQSGKTTKWQHCEVHPGTRIDNPGNKYGVPRCRKVPE